MRALRALLKGKRMAMSKTIDLNGNRTLRRRRPCTALRGAAAVLALAGVSGLAAELARSARRAYGHPDLRHAEIGFRIVCER